LEQALDEMTETMQAERLMRQQLQAGNAAARLGEWYYSPFDGSLYGNEHDAALHLTGDFADITQKTAYADLLCAKLNAAPREAEAGAVQETTGAPAVPALSGPGGDVSWQAIDGEEIKTYRCSPEQAGKLLALLHRRLSWISEAEPYATYGSDK
jgi:hypothetical protein